MNIVKNLTNISPENIQIDCIKEECKHYQEHDFFNSYAYCDLEHQAFKKDFNKICVLPRVIYEAKQNLKFLELELRRMVMNGTQR